MFLSWDICNGCDDSSLNPRFPAIATSPNDDPRAADVYIDVALLHYIKIIFLIWAKLSLIYPQNKKVTLHNMDLKINFV